MDGAEPTQSEPCGRSHRYDSAHDGLLQKRLSTDTKTVWLACIGYEVLERHALISGFKQSGPTTFNVC